MEGDRVAHVVISHIVVAGTIAVILIVLIIFQNFFLHGGCIRLNLDSFITNNQEQCSVVGTAFANVSSCIYDQVIAVIKRIFTGSQSRTGSGLIGICELSNCVGQTDLGVILTQDLCYSCGIGTISKETSISGIGFQGCQESIAINAAAPAANVGQNAIFLTTGENLESGKGVVLQNSIRWNGDCRAERGGGQDEEHDQGNQEAGEFSHVFHCFFSFLFSFRWSLSTAHQEDV